MSFAFVPYYLYYLGLEAYGLIGFFSTLLAVFSFLDLGLSTALNRELALRSSSSADHATMRTVVRTFELVYGSIGIIIGGLVFALATPIARYWLNTTTLSFSEAETAIQLMGIVIALQWPNGLYSGGLLGLQKQVIANAIQAGIVTLRGVGAVLVLAFIAPTISAFFLYQAFVSLAAVLVTRSTLTSHLPPGKTMFEKGVLKAVWRFAAGMLGVSVTTIILMQTDKIILSGLLPMEEYSQYVLAYTMGAVAGFIGVSVHAAIFPRFSQLVAANEEVALQQTFLTQAQLLGAFVAAITLVIMMYAQELTYFWTKDAALASQIAPMTRVLAFGAALNAMMMVPYAVILAHGRSYYAFITNSIAIIFIVPLVYFLADANGASGASFAWPILNLGYVLVQAPIVLGILLPGTWWRWFKSGVLLPFIVAAAAVAPIRILCPNTLSPFSGFAVAILALIAALLSTALSSSECRRLIALFIPDILSDIKLSKK